ncbi:FK506-binding protein 2-like isoform X2 [Tachypleus tridentatus]|uniref:FK506-binding protein 2-like isoform X1 n=1 Tax=Tachypleus tridentatus TaxID=6853 RepID=UPI003FD22853
MHPFLSYFTLIFILVQLNNVLRAGSQENEELEVDILEKPDKCDRKTKKGDILSMQYRGTLDDGTEFDSSYTRKEPFQFQLGISQVIKGWDEGLVDMCVGEKRRLIIPPHMGYGDSGAVYYSGERIPPKATLIFEVELLEIKDGPPPVNVFKEIDSNADQQLSRNEISDYLKKQLPEAEAAGIKDLPEQDKIVEEIFQHEDKDKNGFISHEEFSGPKHDEL